MGVWFFSSWRLRWQCRLLAENTAIFLQLSCLPNQSTLHQRGEKKSTMSQVSSGLVCVCVDQSTHMHAGTCHLFPHVIAKRVLVFIVVVCCDAAVLNSVFVFVFLFLFFCFCFCFFVFVFCFSLLLSLFVCAGRQRYGAPCSSCSRCPLPSFSGSFAEAQSW